MMRQFVISAAAIAALLAAVPANAQQIHGPRQVGNQCLTPAPGHTRDLGFGVWGTCPQPASVAGAPLRGSLGAFEKCEQLAIERGVPHGQTGHTEFVQQCMGQRPKGRSTG
jgi:hypothetical protein